MLRNYLLVAFRTLARFRVYAALNVLGLAIGMAACLLIGLYVRDELRYDRFHERADRLYRVVASTSGDGQPTNANGAFSLAVALEGEFPEVRRAVRLWRMGWDEKRVVARGERRFAEERFFFADPAFFELFSFSFVAGDPATALREPRTLVLTERSARKFFGDTNVLGRVLSVDPFNDGRFADYRITGVLQDLPSGSHLRFDFLASIRSVDEPEGWGFDPVYTYLLLAGDASPRALEAKLPAFLRRHMGPEPWYSIRLQPITDIRLRSNLRAELEPNGDVRYVYLFSAIAVFVLAIACINFMNLATAQSTHRAREVGMRKVLGARRAQLVRQFIGEAVLLSLLAVILALLLVELLLPVFNGIANKQIEIRYAADLGLLGGLAALALLTGVAAGSYPAFFLSAFRPVEVMKQRAGARSRVSLRRGLVVFQFAVSVLLLVCTTVVQRQMDLVRTKQLGFDREQVLVLPLNDELRRRYDAFRAALLRSPGVLGATASEQVPARAGNGSSYLLEGVEEPLSMSRLFVDPHFLRTYGIPLAAGRDFSDARASDSTGAFLVNEAFLREAGLPDARAALGRMIRTEWNGRGWSGQIIGVTRDFHLSSFRDAVWPVVLNVMPLEQLNFLSVRLAPGDAHARLAQLRQTWGRFVSRYPFDYYFLDEDFERLHRSDERLGRLFGYFALLSILVACLGLFGLSAFTAEQRTKEIGVRKVLGASVPDIVAMLSREFLQLILVASALACPLAYLGMKRWLEHFAFRVEIAPDVFLLAGGLVLLVGWLTISYQALRSALTSPVRSLRYE